MPRVLIVGYGNPLRGDDGLGWHAVERLRGLVQDPAVNILALHQLIPELMETVAGVDRVIFIDACEGPIPGEIRERGVEPAGSGAAFTHHSTPAALLAGAMALYGRAAEAWLITVTGAEFALSDQLSPAAQAAVDPLVRVVLRRLAQQDTLPGRSN